MIYISDYSTDLIKINKDNSNIFFLAKEGLIVSGVNGNLVLTTSLNTTYTYPFKDVESPSYPILDQLVVKVREYIDNG